MNKRIMLLGIVVALTLLVLGGCKKEEPVEIPPTPDTSVFQLTE